jgi:acyl-CoA thioesterase-1
MNTAFTLKRYCILLRVLLLVAAPLVGTYSAFAESPPAATSQKIIVLGDSLSAEYGLRRGTGWVPLLAERLNTPTPDKRGKWIVVNASISGDTTAGGKARLPGLMRAQTAQVLVIELGGNDALRGLPLKETRANLLDMVAMAQQKKMRVLLLGMQMPPNYGANYAKQFEQMYQEIANSQKVALVPFFLKGVADVPQASSLFQADRIHPNEAAQAQLLANVLPQLLPLLQSNTLTRKK